MQIATLTLPELRNLYDTALVRDFPPAERKPFSAMEALLRRGLYEPLVFTDPAGERVAYALQVAAPDVPCGLIDYFAVRADLRGGGVGTCALHALRRHYAGRLQALLTECEHPAEAPDPETARRRIGFYLRAGAQSAAMESRVAGVRYMVLALPCLGALSEAVAADALRRLYIEMSPQSYGRGNVIFYGN